MLTKWPLTECVGRAVDVTQERVHLDQRKGVVGVIWSATHHFVVFAVHLSDTVVEEGCHVHHGECAYHSWTIPSVGLGTCIIIENKFTSIMVIHNSLCFNGTHSVK
jgi:hypothetical protein